MDANRDEFPNFLIPPFGSKRDETAVSLSFSQKTTAFQGHEGYTQTLMWKVSKHCTALHTSINGYCIPVFPVICWEARLHCNCIASHCCTVNWNASILASNIPNYNETALKSCWRSNVSSEQSKYLSPSILFSISALVASND